MEAHGTQARGGGHHLRIVSVGEEVEEIQQVYSKEEISYPRSLEECLEG